MDESINRGGGQQLQQQKPAANNLIITSKIDDLNLNLKSGSYEAFVSGNQLYRWYPELGTYIGRPILPATTALHCPNPLISPTRPHNHDVLDDELEPGIHEFRRRFRMIKQHKLHSHCCDAGVQVARRSLKQALQYDQPLSTCIDELNEHVFKHEPTKEEAIISPNQSETTLKQSKEEALIWDYSDGFLNDSLNESPCEGKKVLNADDLENIKQIDGSSSSNSSSASATPTSFPPTTVSNRHERFLSISEHLLTCPQSQFPPFDDVEDALSILEVAHQNKNKDVINACIKYLSATAWSKGDEAQILMFFKRRKHISCTGALMKRLKMNLSGGMESSTEIMKRIITALLSAVFESYDNNGFASDEITKIMKLAFADKTSESTRKAVSSVLYNKWNEVLPQLHRRGHVRDLHRLWIFLTKALTKYKMGNEAVATLSKGEMGLARIREVIGLEYAGMPETLDLFDGLVMAILKAVMKGKVALPTDDNSRLNLAKAATRAFSLYQPTTQNNGHLDKLHTSCEIIFKEYLSELPIEETAAFDKSWQSLCKELDYFPWPDISDLINGWRLIRGAQPLNNKLS